MSDCNFQCVYERGGICLLDEDVCTASCDRNESCWACENSCNKNQEVEG